MSTKLLIVIIAVAAALVGAFVFVSFVYPGLGGGSGGTEELELVSYSALPGDISPVLKLKFSHDLDSYNTIKILDGFYKSVGTWAPINSTPGNIVRINHITPPNLIGMYHVVVMWKTDVVLNTTINFETPELDVITYHLKSEEKGDTVYVEYINITLSESGDSPYYYNRIRWTLDGEGTSEKIPMDHFEVGGNKMVRVNLARYLDKGQHTLVVHFDYFDFNTVTVVINFGV